jgi:hypothetical protein
VQELGRLNLDEPAVFVGRVVCDFWLVYERKVTLSERPRERGTNNSEILAALYRRHALASFDTRAYGLKANRVQFSRHRGMYACYTQNYEFLIARANPNIVL